MEQMTLRNVSGDGTLDGDCKKVASHHGDCIQIHAYPLPPVSAIKNFTKQASMKGGHCNFFVNFDALALNLFLLF